MLNIVSGPAGSGKTQYAINQIKDKNFIYVAPSIKMCKAFAARCADEGIQTKIINSETSNSTTAEIVEVINSSDKQKLIITEQSYRLISGKIKIDDYILVIDEFPNIFQSMSIPFDDASDIEKYFDIKVESKEILLKAEYKSKTKYFTFPNRLVSQLLSMLQHGTCRAYVSSIKERNIDGAKTTRLGVELLLTPQYFGSNTILMGANHTSRFAYKYLNSLGLVDSVIELTAPIDNHKSRKIVFLSTTPHNTSLTMKTERMDDWFAIVEQLDTFFKKRDTLLLRNKRDTFKYSDANYHELGHNCHGIDDLKHYRNVLITTDVNPSKVFVKAAADVLGMSENDILEERQLELDYQTIMRSAIRDRNKLHKAVYIGIPTHSRALRQIKYFFPNARHLKLCDIVKLNNIKIIGRPKLPPVAKTDRNKFYSMQKNLSNYPDYVQNDLTTKQIRDIIVSDWWSQYNSRGNKI